MNTTVSSRYILTRTLIAVALGFLVGWKTYWWSGILVGAAALAFFIWAPGSGRYRVQADGGAAPLRLDERTRELRNRAARDAFVVLLLATSILLLYYGLIVPSSIPVQMLMIAWGLGGLTYFVSDALQRQGQGGGG